MARSKPKRKKLGISQDAIGTRSLYNNGIPRLNRFSISITGIALNRNGRPTQFKI